MRRQPRCCGRTGAPPRTMCRAVVSASVKLLPQSAITGLSPGPASARASPCCGLWECEAGLDELALDLVRDRGHGRAVRETGQGYLALAPVLCGDDRGSREPWPEIGGELDEDDALQRGPQFAGGEGDRVHASTHAGSGHHWSLAGTAVKPAAPGCTSRGCCGAPASVPARSTGRTGPGWPTPSRTGRPANPRPNSRRGCARTTRRDAVRCSGPHPPGGGPAAARTEQRGNATAGAGPRACCGMGASLTGMPDTELLAISSWNVSGIPWAAAMTERAAGPTCYGRMYAWSVGPRPPAMRV